MYCVGHKACLGTHSGQPNKYSISSSTLNSKSFSSTRPHILGEKEKNLPSSPFYLQCVCVHLIAQPCPTFSAPWTIVHKASLPMEFSKARILEWVAISYSRVSFWPRDWTHISVSPALAGGFFSSAATWEALYLPLQCPTESWYIRSVYTVNEWIHRWNSFIFIVLLAVPCSLQDLNTPTGDWTLKSKPWVLTTGPPGSSPDEHF